MEKKSFIKRIKEKISKFFEEKKNESEEEEINLKTLIIIFLIGFIIIISIYIYTNKGFEFLKSDSDETEEMKKNNDEEKISEISDYFEDYFVGKKGLENSNFSEGMNHWSTSDGGKLYKESISKRTLNKGDYHSLPHSLQIDCFQPSCRIHYDTKPHSIIIDNPHNPKSGIWMGVKPGTKLRISYWYKGCDHVFYLMSLDKEGNFKNFLEVINSYSSIEWVKKELIIVVLEDEIAIGTEITINFEGILLLDDIQLEKVE